MAAFRQFHPLRSVGTQGGVNLANFGDRAAPMWSREGILNSLENATGLLAEG